MYMYMYLYLNMINFDEVDFSEHRSEEVKFLLTLSVCTCTKEGYGVNVHTS